MPFKSVAVLPLDENQKKTLLANADSPTKIYAISFRLSGGPVQGWSDVFSNLWYSENHNNNARVSGTTLQLQSSIDGIPELFVRAKSVVAAANKRFQEQQEQKAETQAAQKKQKDQAHVAAQDALKSVLEKIDYS